MTTYPRRFTKQDEALDRAVLSFDARAIELAILAGADPNMPDAAGRTPLARMAGAAPALEDDGEAMRAAVGTLLAMGADPGSRVLHPMDIEPHFSNTGTCASREHDCRGCPWAGEAVFHCMGELVDDLTHNHTIHLAISDRLQALRRNPDLAARTGGWLLAAREAFAMEGAVSGGGRARGGGVSI
jgi:hypothetical protein